MADIEQVINNLEPLIRDYVVVAALSFRVLSLDLLLRERRWPQPVTAR